MIKLLSEMFKLQLTLLSTAVIRQYTYGAVHAMADKNIKKAIFIIDECFMKSWKMFVKDNNYYFGGIQIIDFTCSGLFQVSTTYNAISYYISLQAVLTK